MRYTTLLTIGRTITLLGLLAAIALLAMMLASCVTAEAVQSRYEKLAAAYRLEAGLPEGIPLPADKEAELRVKADLQVRAEVAAARQAAIAKAAEAGGRAVAGDYVGAILALIGLVGGAAGIAMKGGG